MDKVGTQRKEQLILPSGCQKACAEMKEFQPALEVKERNDMNLQIVQYSCGHVMLICMTSIDLFIQTIIESLLCARHSYNIVGSQK